MSEIAPFVRFVKHDDAVARKQWISHHLSHKHALRHILQRSNEKEWLGRERSNEKEWLGRKRERKKEREKERKKERKRERETGTLSYSMEIKTNIP